jgi:hypothetical protein
MHLAQDNDVVHTFTPDRSDQAFGKAILHGRDKATSAARRSTLDSRLGSLQP